MYNIKSNLILVVLVFFSISATTQPLYPQTGVNQKNTKRICEFSLFVGGSYGGPMNDISASMRASALHESPGYSYDSTAYPDLHRRAIYFFEFKYNLNQRSGISLSRGKYDAFSIHRDANSPTVRSVLRSTNLDYEHSLGHNRHELSTGISFISLQMKSTDHDDRVFGDDGLKRVGINLGYAYHIIETKGFFLAFNAQYNWAGTATIGPYSIYENGYSGYFLIWDISVPSRTTTFPATTVHLDSFNIGFSIGFRFAEQEGADAPQ